MHRGVDREQQSQLFFHISEVRLEPDQAIEAGSEVSFATVPDTQGKGEGNPIAVRIQLLPDGTLEAEKRLPGDVCPPACMLNQETVAKEFTRINTLIAPGTACKGMWIPLLPVFRFCLVKDDASTSQQAVLCVASSKGFSSALSSMRMPLASVLML